jgi:hypothetical protein
MRMWVQFFLLLLASTASAQMIISRTTTAAAVVPDTVKVDASATSGTASSTNTRTATLTVGNNPNRLMLALVAGYTVPAISTITCGGNAMTLLVDFTIGGDWGALVYYYIAPATGSNDVVVTLVSSAGDLSITAVSLYNVNQSGGASTVGTAIETVVSGVPTPNPMIVGSITSQARDLVIGCYVSYGLPWTGLSSGETEIIECDGASDATDGWMTKKDGTATVSIQGDAANELTWMATGFSIHHSGD